MNAKTTAGRIMRLYETNADFRTRVASSPEPFRAMIYECGLVNNVAEIDGTAAYVELVDEIEKLV